MGRVVRSSRAVECVNSVVRMHQARHRRVNEGRLDLKNCQLKKLWCETIPLSVLLIRREAYAFQQAATPKFEVKRYGDPGYSNDGMAVSPGGYSASDFAGSAYKGFPLTRWTPLLTPTGAGLTICLWESRIFSPVS